MNSQDGAQDVGQPPASSFATVGHLLGGRYRLEELIGQGGTAEVYRATDEVLGRAVAVKVFDVRLTDLNTLERQRSEMRLLAALDDPHLVAVYDARMIEASDAPGAVREHSYLVMEFMPGGTLADRLREGPLSPADLASVGVAIASGLAAAHARGLVHRDVKPANVLTARSGSVKLGDFGLARMVAAQARVTSSSSLIGTAAYFSPEQASSEHVGAAADVYSLGLVLLEALTGRREFPGAAVPSAIARLLRDPELPDGLPAPWPTLLLRMTDRDPAARPTAADVARTLSGTTTGTAITDHTATDHTITERMPVDQPAARTDTGGEPPATRSSALSAFLRPDTADGTGVRRRNGLLVGAAAVIAAVALTVGISMSAQPPSDAGTTPPLEQNSDPRPAPSSSSTSSRIASKPAGSNTAPSKTVVSQPAVSATAALRTAATKAAATTPRPPATTPTTKPGTSTSSVTTGSTLTAAPVAARTSPTQQQPQQQPSRPTSSTPAARPAATSAAAPPAAPPPPGVDKAAQKAADAERRAAEKAADAARKAADKQAKADQKNASQKAKGGGSPGPGKKP